MAGKAILIPTRAEVVQKKQDFRRGPSRLNRKEADSIEFLILLGLILAISARVG